MAEGQTSQSINLSELLRNTKRQQEMIDLLMSQGQPQQASQTVSSTLTPGLRDVTRSLSNWNKENNNKRYDYEASGLQRIAFIKKCMNDSTGNDYEEGLQPNFKSATGNARSSLKNYSLTQILLRILIAKPSPSPKTSGTRTSTELRQAIALMRNQQNSENTATTTRIPVRKTPSKNGALNYV